MKLKFKMRHKNSRKKKRIVHMSNELFVIFVKCFQTLQGHKKDIKQA